ncbi:hemicentin-2-like [Anopheles aquasalis]|uniref:hemicentin-2-like n=1 Tax=Anopheles aquasalis TaxID=42839 RepID=UPI00215A94F9|nr:hemicentin-2-like [Anopheles aquasalis]
MFLDILEGLLKPTIHSNVRDYVPIGITVRLTCNYEVFLDRNIKMSWKTLPSYQLTEIDKAIFVGNQTEISMHNRTLIKRELVIENVTLAHQRTYRCEVFDDKNNTHYHNFKLQVRETPDDFVILSTAHNRTVINRRLNENGETTPIQIIIQHKSYPFNITYEWFRDEAGIIARNETDDYQQEVTEDYVKLRIKQPKVYHTDSYTVSVQAGTASANFSISVFVYGKPSLSMDSIKAIKGDLAIFSCLAESYPSVDESFIFQPCAAVPWGNCSIVNETDPGWHAGTDEVAAIHWASATFKIVANEPGIVYCKANNTEGHAIALAYLMLEDLTSEDVKTDFIKLEIVQPKRWITVGDNVSFVCSVVTLGDTVVMSFEHNEKSYPGTVIQDDSVMKKMQFTLFNVSYHDSGDVFCIVNYGIKPTEQRSLDMEVIEAIAPQLRSGEINQTLIVDVLNPFKLECDVGGIPSPTITWFKDGAPYEYNVSDPTGVSSIIFEYAIPTQSGLYECIGENKKGNITITRNVTVRKLKLSEPLLYATVMLLLLTIALAITSLFLYVKMKQATGVSHFQGGRIQIVPSLQ